MFSSIPRPWCLESPHWEPCCTSWEKGRWERDWLRQLHKRNAMFLCNGEESDLWSWLEISWNTVQLQYHSFASSFLSSSLDKGDRFPNTAGAGWAFAVVHFSPSIQAPSSNLEYSLFSPRLPPGPICQQISGPAENLIGSEGSTGAQMCLVH